MKTAVSSYSFSRLLQAGAMTQLDVCRRPLKWALMPLSLSIFSRMTAPRPRNMPEAGRGMQAGGPGGFQLYGRALTF